MALPNIDLMIPEQSSITPEVLQKTVGKIGVNIPDHLVEDYTTTLSSAQQAMEMVMAMDGESPEPLCPSYDSECNQISSLSLTLRDFHGQIYIGHRRKRIH